MSEILRTTNCIHFKTAREEKVRLIDFYTIQSGSEVVDLT